MAEVEDRRWKVGELAQATGVTVRTLHHYDDVGLLAPYERTSGGHRLYAGHDVRRLYLILALRRLGLGLEEIAALLDDDSVSLIDTVRRHLEQVERELDHQHRLQRRLREMLTALERAVEPAADDFIDAMEAMSDIETTVEDVVIRLPAGETDEPPPRLAREGYRVVLLKERGGERVLPIWIGAQEGDLLAARLGEWSQGRPMGPDLTVQLLKAGGVRVDRVVVERLDGNTFYATVTVTADGGSHEVDARPSDALNLAVRVGAPVFVAPELIEQAGTCARGFASLLSGGESDAGLAEWRSLSPDVIRSLDPPDARAPWGRFTGQALQVTTFAREEARAAGQDAFGPVHLLLGLLRETDGLAAQVLDNLGLTLERVRDQLEPASSPLDPTTSGAMTPPKPEAGKVFELALAGEPTRRPREVGTEHILLGLAGSNPEVLAALGLEAEGVMAAVRRAMS